MIRGRVIPGNSPPKLKLNSGEVVTISGDDPTLAVLKDPRVITYDVELAGHYEQPGRFAVNPIHKPALFAYKEGHRYQVSYWCPVCSIRSYSPGKCWCCQEETHLDLIEPPSAP